jgi:hypothetical protein
MSIKTPNTKINLINNRIKYGTDGGINVDSNTLFVNATTGRVGINTTTPNTLLDISGSIKSSGIADYSNSTGNNTQILTKANGQNLWSYPGYNYSTGDMFPENEVDLSGVNYLDSNLNKFFGGVLAPNGKIYMIPSSANHVLILNPYTNEVDLSSIIITNPGSGWFGGVLAPNGKIYCVPANSSQILVIDTNDNSYYYISGITNANYPTIAADIQKWGGGVLASNGKIYCIPYFSEAVMIIDTQDDSINLTDISGLNNINYPNLLWKTGARESFFGGVLGPDGKIYCMPNSAYGVMVINPEDNSIDVSSYLYVNAFPSSIRINGQRFGYWGGCLAQDGNIYSAPWNFNRILKIDLSNQYLTIVTPDISLSTNQNYWIGTVCSLNGKLYGIPSSFNKVLLIDPITNTANATSISTGSETRKNNGAVLSPNGKIYCVPRDSSIIATIKTGIPKLQPWMIAPEFNKF